MAFERARGLIGTLFDKMSEYGAPDTENFEFEPQESIEMSPDMLRTKKFEGGHKSKAYLDSLGYPTIGTGSLLEHKAYDEMPSQYAAMEMSEVEGDSLYNKDYNTKLNEVKSLYGEGFDSLPKEAQGVMTDMAYNVGSQGLFTKFPGMIEDIRSGNYAGAANQLKYKNPELGDIEGNMSNWWEQVGGANTESKNLVRSGNRATSNYDVLYGLGDNVSSDPVNDVMNNNTMMTNAFPTK